MSNHTFVFFAFIFGAFLLFAIISSLIICVNKKDFEVTSYKVFPDRIEFEQGFINHKYTVIRLEDVKEIHLHQNFIQRIAKLGTIRFVTPANVSNARNIGVSFLDIENSNYVYAKIKELKETK